MNSTPDPQPEPTEPDLSMDDFDHILVGIVGTDLAATSDELEQARRQLTTTGTVPLWGVYLLGIREGVRSLLENREHLMDEVRFLRANRPT